MKTQFHGYYKPSKEGFDALWKDSVIVVDANVLLNLYTYSKETWEGIITLLEGYKDRIWLPHQAGIEYHRNRPDIITKEATSYGNLTNELSGICNALSASKRHPFIEQSQLDELNKLVEQIQEELARRKEEFVSQIHNDPICDRITKLFDGKVGPPYPQDRLKEIYVEGKERYDRRIPPGYKDDKKSEPEKYGDLVLWKQLISHASSVKRSVLLITDDAKEDWWFTTGSTRIGPRPELIQEFRKDAEQDIYVYGSDSFVKQARKYGDAISDKAVAEVQTAAKERMKETIIKNQRQVEELKDIVRRPGALSSAQRRIFLRRIAEEAGERRRVRDAWAAQYNKERLHALFSGHEGTKSLLKSIQSGLADWTDSDVERWRVIDLLKKVSKDDEIISELIGGVLDQNEDGQNSMLEAEESDSEKTGIDDVDSSS